MCFFLRFSTDAIVLLAHWVREGMYCYAVGTNTFRDWSSFYPWKSFPSEAEKYSTVQLWFIISQLRRTSEALD